MLGPKNLVQNSFGLKKIFVQINLVAKNDWSEKNQVPKIIWVQKYFASKNILGPKELWVQKNLSLKNILSQKFLVPPLLPMA